MLETIANIITATTPVDWFILLLVLVSVIAAFVRGLIRSLISLVSCIAGIALAAMYSARIASSLLAWIHPSAAARIAAFLAIVLAVAVVGSLLGRVIRGAAHAVGLGLVDRLTGAGFGFARAYIFLSALLIPALPFLQTAKAAQRSVLLPYLLPAAHGISFVMPREFGERIQAGDRWLHPDAPFHRYQRSMSRRQSPGSRGEQE